MFLLVLFLLLSAASVFDIALVLHIRRGRQAILLKRVRWTLTVYMLLMGIAALIVLRDGIEASGKQDMRFKTTLVFSLFYIFPLLSTQDPEFLIPDYIISVYLLAGADVRLLLTAGLDKRQWTTENENPFFWTAIVPRALDPSKIINPVTRLLLRFVTPIHAALQQCATWFGPHPNISAVKVWSCH